MRRVFRVAVMAAFLVGLQSLAAGPCVGQVASSAEGASGEASAEMHELLQALRGLQTTDLAIEVRFISVNEKFFERLGVWDVTFHNAHRQPVEIEFPPLGSQGPVPPGNRVAVGPGRTLTVEGLEGYDLTKIRLRLARGPAMLHDLPVLNLGGILDLRERGKRPDRSLFVSIRARILNR
jgi:hypothetical protein